MVPDDIRFMGASYRMGGFPLLPRDLPKDDFWPTLLNGYLRARPNAAIGTLLAKVPERGEMPVGWVIAWPLALASQQASEYRVAWAPWATPRNRLEAMVAFLHRSRSVTIGMGAVRRDEARLYEHACRYGVGRTVGTVKALYSPTDDGMLFQTVELR